MITTGTEARRAAAIRAPQENVPSNEFRGNAHRENFLGGGGNKRQGIDEVAPGQSKREDGDCKEPRYGDGQDNPDERLDASGPIHHGALLQLFRDGTEVTHLQPGPKGNQEGRVSKNQGPEAVRNSE